MGSVVLEELATLIGAASACILPIGPLVLVVGGGTYSLQFQHITCVLFCLLCYISTIVCVTFEVLLQ
jgi:hypothetical protein